MNYWRRERGFWLVIGFLVLLAVLLELVSCLATPAQAQEQTARDIADLHFATIEDTIYQSQQNWWRTYGEYFQGLQTHNTPPANGIPSRPDNLAANPTDRPGKNWLSFVADLGLLPYSLAIDVYQGRRGQGYVVRLRVLERGELWERRINVGPELPLGRGWELVDDES